MAAVPSFKSITLVAVAAGTLMAGPAVGAPAQECAFVANQDSGTVSVIDAATNAVTRTIQISYFYDPQCFEAPLPGAQPRSIAISPDGTRASCGITP